MPNSINTIIKPLPLIERKYNTTLDNIPILERKIHTNIAPDVSYCYMGEIEMFNGTSGDLGYFLQQTGLNITNIYDDIENGISNYETSNIYKCVEIEFNKWYNNTASPMEKSMVFYKFLFGLKYQLEEYSTTLFEYLEKIDFKIDKRLKFSNIQLKLLPLLNSNIDNDSECDLFLSTEDENKIAYSKIKDLLTFLVTLENKYTFYKNNTTHTLDELMIISAFQFINSSVDLLNFSMPGDNSNKKIKLIQKKKEQKGIRRMLNKSIDTIKTFLPAKDIDCFISGETFEISGTHFNYRISKKENYPLLQNPNNLNSVHIPYELDLFNKDNEYLANLCITFNGCPILDQILSLYLMISSNQEADMLDKCNFYKHSPLLKTDKTVQEVIPDRFQSKTILENIMENMEENDNIIENTSSTFKLNIDTQKSKIKKFKDYSINKILPNFIDNEAIDFIFNTEVSWDEMTDYYSISREGDINLEFGHGGVFSDDRLDNLVTI